jgi:O-antigen ligase
MSMRKWLLATFLSLYVLAGRWGFERLFQTSTERQYAISPFQARTWIIIPLVVLALVLSGSSTRRRTPPGVTVFGFALGLFLLYFLATGFWAPDPSIALSKVIEILMIVLASVSLYIAIRHGYGETLRPAFWRIVFLATAVLAVIALGKAVSEGPARLAVLGGGPNVFGRLMALLCLASLYIWRRGGRALYVLACVVSVILVILSGSRGCIVSLVAAVIVFFALERIRFRRLAVFSIVACVITVVILAYTEIGRSAIARYEYRVNQLLLVEGYSSGRADLAQSAYQLGWEHPILGAGLAAFPGLRLGAYPHNLFLETFSETGFVGTLLLCVLLGFFARHAWALRHSIDGATGAAVVFLLGSSQFSGDLYDSRALFLFMLWALVPKNETGVLKMESDSWSAVDST